jgi:hypothetical protein
MFHREALAFGLQQSPQVEDQPAIEFGVGSRRYAVEQLYGMKVLQDGKGIAVAS